ncbi:MAG: beta-ketoacyl synthase N-terminal-like domain-containing protein [Planctomycetota bacterium]
MNPRREVVVTGLGVVSPIGIGAEAFWDALESGVSGVGIRPRFESFDNAHRIAATIKEDFNPKQFVRPRKALKIMCAPIQYGCAAAMMAVSHAGLSVDDVDSNRLGIVFGTETFFADPDEVADVFQKCTVDKDYQHERWGEFAMREIQPLWMLKYLPNMAASHISIALDARGPSNSICQGEASGSLALIEAADLIQRGVADVVIAGGTGSQMTLTATLYRGTNMLSKRIHEPQQASRPFDRDRDGMVVGEGAGAIVLESAEYAAARGAKALARVVGWSRGYGELDQEKFGDEIDYHLTTALERGNLSADDIGLVSANASGSVNLDAVEAQSIQRVLGETPVVAYKSHFGNIGPGTSTVEMIGGLLGIENGRIAPMINCDHVAEDCPVRVVTNHDSAPGPIQHMIKTSISSTGQIAVVAISRT